METPSVYADCSVFVVKMPTDMPTM